MALLEGTKVNNILSSRGTLVCHRAKQNANMKKIKIEVKNKVGPLVALLAVLPFNLDWRVLNCDSVKLWFNEADLKGRFLLVIIPVRPDRRRGRRSLV